MGKRRPPRPEGVPENYRRCGHCKEWKHESLFTKDRGTPDGISYRCRDCDRIYNGSKTAVPSNGNKKSKDLTGIKFGRLLVLEKLTDEPKLYSLWKCLCDCGKYFQTRHHSLIKGSTISCGCWKLEWLHNKHSKPDGAIRRAWSRYRAGAKKRNYPFELSLEDFQSIVLQNCFYCGSFPSIKVKAAISEITHSGIDRINNSEGYYLSNCIPCCHPCNYAKSNKTQEEFLMWVKKVYEHSGLQEKQHDRISS